MARTTLRKDFSDKINELIARRDAMSARYAACPLPGNEIFEKIAIEVLTQTIAELQETFAQSTIKKE